MLFMDSDDYIDFSQYNIIEPHTASSEELIYLWSEAIARINSCWLGDRVNMGLVGDAQNSLPGPVRE